MASGTQQRPRSKSWVRGGAGPSTLRTSSGHSRVWTRPGASECGGADITAAQPLAPPQSVAGVTAQQQLRHAAQQPPASLPLAHARTSSTGDSKPWEGLPSPASKVSPAPTAKSALSGSSSQLYVRKRPNQLTLSNVQQHAAQGDAAACPQQSAAASEPRFGGQPASTLPMSRHQTADVPRFAGATHPRDVLQQQMCERAAALAGRSAQQDTLHSSTAAEAAKASGVPQSAVFGAQRRAAPAGRKALQKAASKKWVWPESASAAFTNGAGRSTTAGTAAGTNANGSAQKQRGRPGPASAVAGHTSGRAYRPLLPAWAMRGSGPRGMLSSHRHQSSSLRAERKARTWVRQGRQAGSSGTPAQPSAAMAMLNPQRKATHTWRRETVALQSAASNVEDAKSAAAAAAAQARAAQSMRQAAEHVPHRLAMRRRRAEAPGTAAQRPAKLLRIAGHMYRVGGGKGGSRTLQRQPHTPAPAVSMPTQQGEQVRAGRANRYSVRGKFRRALVRRLSGMPGSPSSVQGSAVARKLRMQLGSSPFAARSGGIRKRTAISRLSCKPRAKSAKLPPQIYCTNFCRTGQCNDRQRCKFVHDPSKVAVCLKWLQGRCEAAGCPLQHQLRPDLMPVCTFFLQGACSKTDCPYLHVKLDPGARVCEAFLRGWCPDGATCQQKHLTPEMVRQLRRQRILRPGAQATGRAKQTKRKRYFEADSAADAEAAAAAGLVGSPVAADLSEAAASEDAEDANWESASDSEVDREGLAWGDFMEL